MKSLLKTLPRVTERRFESLDLRTNLELFDGLASYQEAAEKDRALINAIVDTMVEVESNDLRVSRLSVIRKGRKTTIRAFSENGTRFPGPGGRMTTEARTVIRHETCPACGRVVYDEYRTEAEYHQRGCDAIKVYEVMED